MQYHSKGSSKGLGDTVKKVIESVTGKKASNCGPCQKRREALNRLMPYKSKPNKEDNK